MGLLALKTAKVVGRIAVIENGYDELADVYALRKEEIPTEEPKILERAKKMVPRIPFDAMDVLICCELGKIYQGPGWTLQLWEDPSIIGPMLDLM